jgi:hypothetical protein
MAGKSGQTESEIEFTLTIISELISARESRRFCACAGPCQPIQTYSVFNYTVSRPTKLAEKVTVPEMPNSMLSILLVLLQDGFLETEEHTVAKGSMAHVKKKEIWDILESPSQ